MKLASCQNEPKRILKKTRGVPSRCKWLCRIGLAEVKVETENSFVLSITPTTLGSSEELMALLSTYRGGAVGYLLECVCYNGGTSVCLDARISVW